MTKAIYFGILSMILAGLSVLPVPGQTRNNLDPATTESTSSGDARRIPAGRDRNRRRGTTEVVVQILGVAAVVFCNTTNKCRGFNATLSTVPGTEYPRDDEMSPTISEQEPTGEASQTSGPVFPFTSESAIGSKPITTNLPSGWRLFSTGQSTIIAPEGGMVDGDLRNGVILGQAAGRSAETVASGLLRQSAYLASDGVIYRVNLNNNMCYKFQYRGTSPRSGVVENVEVYVCPQNRTTFAYAIAVSSGAQATYYRQQTLLVVRQAFDDLG